MTADEQDKQIRDYLKGRLSGEERAAFESRLRQDAALTARLELLRAEMAAAELLIAEDTRALFEHWRQERPGRGLIKGRGPLVWAFAIFAILLSVFGAWWLITAKDGEPAERRPAKESMPAREMEQPKPALPPAAAPMPPVRRPKTKDYIALADKYFQEPVQPTVRRSVADTVQSPLRLAQEAYGQGRYEEALEWLAQVDSTRGQSAAYWQANALYHLRRFAEAEAAFAQLVADNSRQYRYASEWGMLLCRMAVLPKEKDLFEKQLQAIIADPKHPYAGQAVQLDAAIRKLK